MTGLNLARPFTSRPLVLDIETLPTNAALAAPYTPADHNPPSNYKSAEAIAGWHEKNKASWEEKRAKECSVNPRLGRILCLGTGNGVVYAEDEADEPALIESAWEQILAAGGRVVTWNGSFDLRFLVIRSAFHGIRPSVAPVIIRGWFKKYDLFGNFDVKAALLNFDVKAAGEGLDEWAQFFDLPGKPEGVDGGMVLWMYAEGQHEEIQNYCLSDVANTASIYERIAPYFMSVTGADA